MERGTFSSSLGRQTDGGDKWAVTYLQLKGVNINKLDET